MKAEQLTTFEKFLNKHGMIAPVASGIALVCLALMLAALTSWLRVQLHDRLMAVVLSPESSTLQHSLLRYLGIGVHVGKKALWIGTVDQLKIDSLAAFVVFAAVCLLALFANKFININTFSLHGMYRMRLTRSYLGASNFARHPDAFTNFDSSDNMYEADMPCTDAPLHIINTALNLVATRNMAWQQRKAEPFTFSPVSVGSWRLGYLPTKDYGGSQGCNRRYGDGDQRGSLQSQHGLQFFAAGHALDDLLQRSTGLVAPQSHLAPSARNGPLTARKRVASSEGTARSGL